jgi:hypothetical protein
MMRNKKIAWGYWVVIFFAKNATENKMALTLRLKFIFVALWLLVAKYASAQTNKVQV